MFDEAGYLRRLGARVLSAANNLKRTSSILASELGCEEELVRAVIAGSADITAAEALLGHLAKTYPVPAHELLVERSDGDAGVVVMSAEESRQTARTLERPNLDGEPLPYFEYRDTAMSRTAPLKPEWVRPLRVVDRVDPRDRSIVMNNGHLAHQLTFYVGRVNAHWIVDGRHHVEEMATGDSTYMAPFVPHTFVSRDHAAPGLLIAVTFGGEVQRSIAGLDRIEAPELASLAGQVGSARSPVTALVRRYRDADALSAAELARRLVDDGIAEARAGVLARSEENPEGREWQVVARALGVRPADLLAGQLDPRDAVVVERARAPKRRARRFPDEGAPAYQLTELARSLHQPGLRGLALHVLSDDPGHAAMRHHLHEYVYNYGETDASIHWGGGRRATLEPGGSACVEPLVDHAFTAETAGADLLVVRVPGALSDTLLNEIACYPAEATERVTRESTRWF